MFKLKLRRVRTSRTQSEKSFRNLGHLVKRAKDTIFGLKENDRLISDENEIATFSTNILLT